MSKIKKLTRHQAQQLNIKSAFLSEKCTGRISIAKQYHPFSKPDTIAKTTRVSI